MGAYTEQIEPPVRSAVMEMRRKGYNTGSSGFFGLDHAEQQLDLHTPLDDESVAWLSEHGITVTAEGLNFKPDNPADLDSIKATWDMVADHLPDLGHHAEPFNSGSADHFRYVAAHGRHDEFLEDWVWKQGALYGYFPQLTLKMLNEGREFGPDVYAAARAAEERDASMQEEIGSEAENLRRNARI